MYDTSRILKQIVHEMTTQLKKEGIVVHRYDSVSTNSIYLKLDYGAANSIRISDHRGKKHLRYRYNVSLREERFHHEKSPEGYDRFYYPPKEVNRLLRNVIEDRNERIEVIGKTMYQGMIRKNKRLRHKKKGFWQYAKEV